MIFADSGGVRGYWSLLALGKLMEFIADEESRFNEYGEVLHSFHPEEWPQGRSGIDYDDYDAFRRLTPEQRFLPCHYFDCICGIGTGG